MTQQLQKATDYVVLDYLKEYMRGELAKHPQDYIEDPLLLDVISKVNERRKDKKAKEKTPYVFITINPKPGSDLLRFMDTIEKAIHKKWISEYYYTLEQRSETEDNAGDGFHTHILLYRDGKRPSEISREFHSTFKEYVGNTKHINIKYIPEKDYDNVLAYIKGEKTDDKMEKVNIDRIWRSMMGLKQFYSSEDVLSDDDDTENSVLSD